MTDNTARDNLIREWMQADGARKAWTAHEMRLRMQIAAQGWGYNPQVEGSVPDGTHRIDLGNGYALKIAFGTTYTLKEGPALDAALTSIRAMPGGYVIQDKVFNHKHTLNKRGFDAAEAEVKRVILPALETKNKTPTLELESPQ